MFPVSTQSSSGGSSAWPPLAAGFPGAWFEWSAVVPLTRQGPADRSVASAGWTPLQRAPPQAQAWLPLRRGWGPELPSWAHNHLADCLPTL